MTPVRTFRNIWDDDEPTPRKHTVPDHTPTVPEDEMETPAEGWRKYLSDKWGTKHHDDAEPDE